MNINKFLIIVFFVSIFSCSTFAQLLKVGVGGGVTQILGPESFTNDISATENESGAGFSTEWNIGLVGKLDLPLIPITPRGFIYYHSLSGKREFPEIVANPTIETSQTILEIGLGAQYNFVSIPAGVDPYITLDLYSATFGEYSRKVNEEESRSDGITRFGGSVGIGTEVSIVPVVNLDLCLSYKMFNLVGKEDGEGTVSAVTLDAFIMINFL